MKENTPKRPKGMVWDIFWNCYVTEEYWDWEHGRTSWTRGIENKGPAHTTPYLESE